MGSVFSTYASTHYMADLVLKLGVATISAFGAIMSHYCEPAEDEPFEDFAELLSELCSESTPVFKQTSHPGICNSTHRLASRCLAPPKSTLDSHPATNVRMKKLYLVMLDQAIKIAKRFRRRFDLYGPPDWYDPGMALLPTMSIFGAFDFNVIPSIFPFAVPHILISPSSPNDPHVAWSNSLHRQDHEWGQRLIVYNPPSVSGPHPLVVNAAQAYPFSSCPATPPSCGSSDTLSDIPGFYSDDDDDVSSCSETEESDGLSGETEHSETLGKLAWQPTPSQFWIPEDDEDLPALPEDWQ
ncbi:hypothetical protein BU17DRAFT_60826 [Hysterangium stoloniferum]|nr:hypothetical protein BU17DRAFT_60826 [Hysterangium stoloniferum]